MSEKEKFTSGPWRVVDTIVSWLYKRMFRACLDA